MGQLSAPLSAQFQIINNLQKDIYYNFSIWGSQNKSVFWSFVLRAYNTAVVIIAFSFQIIGKSGIKNTHTLRMKPQTPLSCDEGKDFGYQHCAFFVLGQRHRNSDDPVIILILQSTANWQLHEEKLTTVIKTDTYQMRKNPSMKLWHSNGAFWEPMVIYKQASEETDIIDHKG